MCQPSLAPVLSVNLDNYSENPRCNYNSRLSSKRHRSPSPVRPLDLEIVDNKSEVRKILSKADACIAVSVDTSRAFAKYSTTWFGRNIPLTANMDVITLNW